MRCIPLHALSVSCYCAHKIIFFSHEVSALCRFLEFVEQSGQFFHAATLIALDATACGYSDFVLSKGATIPQLS